MAVKESYTYNRGTCAMIAGPMFAGKSSELLKRILFLEHSGKKILVLKPHIDDRYSQNQIITHNGLGHDAVNVIDLELVKDNHNIKPYNFHTVFLDEIQFFEPGPTLFFVEEALREGVNIVASGLNQDSLGVPFETTSRMMALADEVITLKSYCLVCGRDANKTQRLNRKSNRIVIGGAGQYEPRCNDHWEPK